MAVTADVAGLTGVWTDVYILRRFVDMLKQELLFARFSEPAMIPKNTGGYVARWNIPQSFAGSTTIITEAAAGTVGERTTTAINTVESTMNTYGEWMRLGEIASMSWTPGTGEVFAEQFAFAGADAIDNLIYTQAKTSTNDLTSGDFFAATGTTPAANLIAVVTDFTAIAGFFHSTNARGFRELGGDYLWIMHPNQEIDLATELTTDSTQAWRDTFKQSTPGLEGAAGLISHKIVGRYANVTAMRTTNIDTVVEGVTTYHSIALARWGLGWAGLGEQGPNAPEIKRKRPGPSDTSQPLDLYETIGWKVKLAAAMLDANRCLIVYSASTALN